jgi:hypothetical protein
MRFSTAILWFTILLQGALILGVLQQVARLPPNHDFKTGQLGETTLRVGQAPPTFVGRDAREPHKTRRFSPAAHSMLVFLSTDCETCRSLLPRISPSPSILAGRLHVYIHGDPTSIPLVMRKVSPEVHIYLRGPVDLAEHFGVTAFPKGFLIDDAGHVGKLFGAEDLLQLAEWLLLTPIRRISYQAWKSQRP